MKFDIISKGDFKSSVLNEDMKKEMTRRGMKHDQQSPDLIISVGGDGTLLKAFHQYQHQLDTVAFIGLHTGHLGFYADWLPHEKDELITNIENNSFEYIKYPLLEVTITFNDYSNSISLLALNEATVKTDNGTTLVMDVTLKNKHFERFRGDGLCVSTPSGSTAYNKALGGAIIHPSIEAIQVTEIASINNRVFRTVGSPLVLPNTHTCEVSPVNYDCYQMTVDHIHQIYRNVKNIEFKVAEQKIQFARFHTSTFWERVHNSFISER